MKNLKKVLMTVLMLVVFLVPATGCGEKNYGGIVESYEFVEAGQDKSGINLYNIKIQFSKDADTDTVYKFLFVTKDYYNEFDCQQDNLEELLTNAQFVNYLRTNFGHPITIPGDYHFNRSRKLNENLNITIDWVFGEPQIENNDFLETHILIYDFDRVTDPNTDLLNYIGYIRF